MVAADRSGGSLRTDRSALRLGTSGAVGFAANQSRPACVMLQMPGRDVSMKPMSLEVATRPGQPTYPSFFAVSWQEFELMLPESHRQSVGGTQRDTSFACPLASLADQPVNAKAGRHNS